MTYKKDFMRRHAEGLSRCKPMQAPAVRVLLLHEQPAPESPSS